MPRDSSTANRIPEAVMTTIRDIFGHVRTPVGDVLGTHTGQATDGSDLSGN